MNTTRIKTLLAMSVVIIMASLISSCNKDELNEYIKNGKTDTVTNTVTVDVPDGSVPIFYAPIRQGQCWLFYADSARGIYDSVEADFTPKVTAEGRIFKIDNNGYQLETAMPVVVTPSTTEVVVEYDDTTNILSLELGMRCVGKFGTRVVYPKEDLVLNGTYGVLNSTRNPSFREEAITNYTLETLQGRQLASATQRFLTRDLETRVDTLTVTRRDTVIRYMVVYDTVEGVPQIDTLRVIDTVVVYNHTTDTITRTDTIHTTTHDTVTVRDTVVVTPPAARRWLYTDSVDRHVSTNPNGQIVPGVNTVVWSCDNVREYVAHYDQAPYTEQSQAGFAIRFPHTYNVTGTAYASQIGTTVAIMGNVAFFEGFSVTFTAQQRQCERPTTLGCSLQLTSATLTSNGVVVDGLLDGEQVTATIPVTITTPTPTPVDLDFQGTIVWAVVTDSYKTDQATAEEWIHVLVENNGVYTWYDTVYRNGLSVANFTAQTIDAATAATVATNLNQGVWPALCYHHNNGGASKELGMVRFTAGSPNLIQYLSLGGGLINQLYMVSSTESGHGPVDPRKAVITDGRISYNGIVYTIR